jgi:acyl carrier protein
MKSFEESRFLAVVASALEIDPTKGPVAMGVTVNWDSVAHMDLIFRLEAEFEVSFPIDQVADLDTLEKLRAALKGLSSI